jgi:hypothetical protein
MDPKLDTEKPESVQNRVATRYCFQQLEIQFLNVKLNQTDSDWAEILHTSWQMNFQGLHKIWIQTDL